MFLNLTFADKLPKKGTTKSTFLGLSVRASSPRGLAADKITKLRAAAGAAGRTFATRKQARWVAYSTGAQAVTLETDSAVSGRRTGDESSRTQRAIVRVLQAQGAVPNIGGMYNPGIDISMSFLGSDTTIEVKRRATGFAQLYDWLNDRDVLIGKADRQEPSVVLRTSLAAEIARACAESFSPSGDAP